MAPIVHVIGHRSPDADSVCSAIAYAHLLRSTGERDARPARAGEIDEETAFVLRRFGVPTPPLLSDGTGLALVLVDHNEIAQAIPNVERADVLEVWEHHRMGDLRLPRAILFHCEPVGATATLIAEQYAARGVAPPRAMAGLMLAAILSDTVGFRSPTTTEKDRRVAARLALLTGDDPVALGEELLRKRLAAVAAKSAAEIVRGDLKKFAMAGQRVAIGQVEVADPHVLDARREEILGEMRALRAEHGLLWVVLLVTDVVARASDLWLVGDRRELFEQELGPLVRGSVHLDGCMSRKMQVVPRLEAALARADARPADVAAIAGAR